MRWGAATVVGISCVMAVESPVWADDEPAKSATEMSDVKVIVGLQRFIGAGVDQREGTPTPQTCGPYCPSDPIVGLRGPWDFNAPVDRLAIRAPRLGVDLVLGHRFTIGASPLVWFSKTSASFEGASSGGNKDIDAILLGGAVRAGMLLPISSDVVFWPRAGLVAAYTSSTEHLTGSGRGGGFSSDKEVNYTLFSVALEPTLAVTITRGFGLTAGVDVDIPFAGSRSADVLRRYVSYGAGVSVGAVFLVR
jgi:hypothetical protein